MKKIFLVSFCFICQFLNAQNSPISLTITSNDSTSAFSSQNPIQLIAIIDNGSADTLHDVTINYHIQTYQGQSVRDSMAKLGLILPYTVVKDTFSSLISKADFYVSKITMSSEKANAVKEYGFAVEPQTLISPYPQPKDFKDFWNQTLLELQKVPPAFEMTRSEALSNDTMDVYSVEMHSLGNARVQGWYVIPKGKKNLPALVYFQGYSSNNYPNAAYFKFSKYAQFFLNIRGHTGSQKDVNPGFGGNFLSYGLKDKNTYIFRGAYMDCIRALDFVSSRPEVNPKRIGVWGGSMGGALALVTAALDKRVKMCVFDIPFLSDFRNYFNLVGWPAGEIHRFSAQNNIPMEQIYETLDYFDIKNFAPSVKCPVMMGVGLLDRTCPPAINFAAYNNIQGVEKYFYLYPTTGHGVTLQHNDRLFGWFDKKL